MLWQSEHFHPHISSRTFNPADYAEPASTDENYGNSNNNTWNNTGSFEPDDGTSKCLHMHVCCLYWEDELIFAPIQLQWGHSRQVFGSGWRNRLLVQRWILVTLIFGTLASICFSVETMLLLEKVVFIKCSVISSSKISYCLVYPPENYWESDVLLFILKLGAFFLSWSSCSNHGGIGLCYRNDLEAILLPSLFEANLFAGWFWTPSCLCTFSCTGKLVLWVVFHICTILRHGWTQILQCENGTVTIFDCK